MKSNESPGQFLKLDAVSRHQQHTAEPCLDQAGIQPGPLAPQPSHDCIIGQDVAQVATRDAANKISANYTKVKMPL